MTFLYIIYIIAAYLLGSFPFMILVGRSRGMDLSNERDLHEVLWNRIGRGWGILGVMVDVLKGVIPVLAGAWLQLPVPVVALSALAAITGQMWPVFNHFDGERGNTTGLGIVLTFSLAYGAPWVIVIALSIIAIGVLIRTAKRWRHSGRSLNERLKFGGPPSIALPLSILLGFISSIITSNLFDMDITITFCFAAITALVLLRRLTGGLRQDWRTADNKAAVIINRLLFDRSRI